MVCWLCYLFCLALWILCSTAWCCLSCPYAETWKFPTSSVYLPRLSNLPALIHIFSTPWYMLLLACLVVFLSLELFSLTFILYHLSWECQHWKESIKPFPHVGPIYQLFPYFRGQIWGSTFDPHLQIYSMMYSVIPQMLSFFIYSLRNRNMKEALRRFSRIVFLLWWVFFFGLVFLGKARIKHSCIPFC